MPEIASLLPDTPPVDKLMFSCFGSDAFCSLLKRLPGQRTTVLLCGMETHICVMQTALGALREGYLVHVASDAVSSRTELNWRIGLDRMRAAGAILSSTEMMIYESASVLGRSRIQGVAAVPERIALRRCRIGRWAFGRTVRTGTPVRLRLRLFLLLHANDGNFRKALVERRGLQLRRHLAHDVFRDGASPARMAFQ